MPIEKEPITVAARGLRHEPSSLARTLGIMGSNPTQGMDVYRRLFCICVLCVDSGLVTD
jgi:hypothetical protein